LTKEFEIALIAEGVETAVQAQSLQEVGCRLVQGYFFSKPQPIAHWL
jgi:EAL domain-containing protein (putative c-di-GMP-specific phosphodiesterase class I)